MDIPNLSQQPIENLPQTTPISIPLILVITLIAVGVGFGLSRIFPQTRQNQPVTPSGISQPQLSTDDISSPEQLKAGQLYGNTGSVFKDSATGTIQKGGINGVGTHTLIRDGGPSQSASLTSSTVDLDLFVGKKVEVKGETNAAAKTAWLMDVGSIKILP
jgi:hypothetical protein